MKIFLIIIALVILSFNSIFSQESHHWKNKTLILIKDQQVIFKGHLYKTTDSTIVLSKCKKMNKRGPNETLGRYDYSTIPVKNIDEMKVTRKGRLLKSTLLGAAIGFGIGGAIGVASGDDPPKKFFSFTAGEKGFLLGTTLAECGAITGVIIGSVRLKIPIKGSFDNFNKNKKTLQNYSILQ